LHSALHFAEVNSLQFDVTRESNFFTANKQNKNKKKTRKQNAPQSSFLVLLALVSQKKTSLALAASTQKQNTGRAALNQQKPLEAPFCKTRTIHLRKTPKQKQKRNLFVCKMDPVTFSVAVCLSFVLALCGAATNNNNVAINLNPAPASFSVVNYTCDVAAFAVPLPLPLPANVSLGDTPVSSGWQTLSVASPAPSSADVPASSSSPRPCPPHVDVRFTAAVPVSPLLSLPSAAAQRSFATENFFVVESASVTSWSDAAPTASSWKDDAESSSAQRSRGCARSRRGTSGARGCTRTQR
jgi:hypothetical protein